MFVEKIKWLKTCKPLAQCLTQLQLAVVLAIFCFFITIIDVQGTEINSAWLGRKIYYNILVYRNFGLGELNLRVNF